jgi:hypothetical protein
VIYRRRPRLFPELTLAHGDGSYAVLLARFARVDLLILDDWGLVGLKDARRQDLLEILDDRDGDPIHDHHQSAADRPLARTARRSDARRRDSRSRRASRASPRAHRAVASRNDGRRILGREGRGLRPPVDRAGPPAFFVHEARRNTRPITMRLATQGG